MSNENETKIFGLKDGLSNTLAIDQALATNTSYKKETPKENFYL
jgi:hypothetical protein